MPPKTKISKDDIVNKAVELVKYNGEAAINARAIAVALNCSTQPIFSNFSSMEELKIAVVDAAEIICRDYIKREIESKLYPVYKASGMAYIRFAKEEKELFKLLYMRDRADEEIPTENELNNQMNGIVHNATGLDDNNAKLFHLEMWAFVHGIATMFATNFLDLKWELVSRMLTDTYQGLRKQYGME